MEQMKADHERISFGEIPGIPPIELSFTACRMGQQGYFFDIADFFKKEIDRWSLPFTRMAGPVEILKENIPDVRAPFGVSHETYVRDYMMGQHAAQLSSQGKMFVSMGDFANGFCVYIIDTHSGLARIFPDTFEEEIFLYSSTGAFTPDNEYWMFVRWPLKASLDIMKGKRQTAPLEIGRIRISDNKSEILYQIENIDRIHQISCSTDGRHVVFCPFSWDLNVPYPSAGIDEDPEGYRESHEAGMKIDKLVTVDLDSKNHWRTDIPVPVPAHFEFDPVDSSVFYLSCHHFFPTGTDVILEGPGSIFKMKIKDGETIIDRGYSDDQFYRLSMHMPFIYNGKVLVAVTNLPNKLDLIDTEDMSLWRRIRLFPAPDLDLSKTGNLICPHYPGSSYTVNPSRDGRYVVLESSEDFIVYSLEEDSLIPSTVPRYLPKGTRSIGHTRPRGK